MGYRKVVVIAGIAGVIAVAAFGHATGSINVDASVERRPGETIKTEAYYDHDGRQLTLRCLAATQDICRIIVNNPERSRTFALRPGAAVQVSHVDRRARTCVGGREPMTECSWTPVE